MKFTSVFVASLFLVSSALPVVKRDVPTILADIATISTATTKLDNDINAFPNSGGTVAGALGIHNDAVALGSDVDKGTTDTTSTAAFSEADGTSILNALDQVKPTILDALSAIQTKKAAFDALPLAGISTIVLSDLQNLKTSTDNFANALIAKAPADLVDDATTFKNQVDAAFDAAIAAYTA